MERQDWYTLIKSHIKQCIFFPIVFALVAAAIAWGILPNEYTSQIAIYVLADEGGNYPAYPDTTRSDVSWGLYHEIFASQQISNDIARLAKSNKIVDQVKEDVGLDNLDDYHVEVDSSEKNRVIYFKVKGNDAEMTTKVVDSMTRHISDLSKEIMDVENVIIIDKPKIPSEPSGPFRSLIVAVSAVVGLFLAIFMIFIRDAFSNKIRNKEEVSKLVKKPVLAEYPKI